MMRRWYLRIHDIFATAEAMDSELGSLPEDPLAEYEVLEDTHDVHRLYTFCCLVIIFACMVALAAMGWAATH